MYAPFFPLRRFCRLPSLALLTAWLGACAGRDSDDPRPLRVAAAADLEPAFVELGQRFTAESAQRPGGRRRRVVFSFASSSLLAQQIGQGAPFDLFAAANAELVTALVQSGRLVGASARPYARGQLVLFSRAGLPSPPTIDSLREPQFARIALANPAHAPYGQAALQALTSAALTEPLKRRLVYGENVRQAHQYVDTGNADAGFGALSLRLGSKASDGSPLPYTLVPPALYRPLVQLLGVVESGDREAAERFAQLILSPGGQQILRRYGFLPAFPP